MSENPEFDSAVQDAVDVEINRQGLAGILRPEALAEPDHHDTERPPAEPTIPACPYSEVCGCDESKHLRELATSLAQRSTFMENLVNDAAVVAGLPPGSDVDRELVPFVEALAKAHAHVTELHLHEYNAGRMWRDKYRTLNEVFAEYVVGQTRAKEVTPAPQSLSSLARAFLIGKLSELAGVAAAVVVAGGFKAEALIGRVLGGR